MSFLIEISAHGANKPGLMVLTTSLSRPLRHLEKYAGAAQELEQHLEDDHPDRGDTQRSVAFYKNVAVSCLAFIPMVIFLLDRTIHLLTNLLLFMLYLQHFKFDL